MDWSFKLFDVAGTAVRVHFTFFLLLAWIGAAHWARGGPAEAIDGIVFILLLFACVVLHEFGHIFAARRYGIRTPDVTLLPIGGVASLERMPEKPSQEIVVALAGPAVNLVIALAADGGAGRAVRLDADGAARAGADHPDRPGGRRQRGAAGVQPDPGLPHGRRPRAARAAGHRPRLHARHPRRRIDRAGTGGGAGDRRPDGQSRCWC